MYLTVIHPGRSHDLRLNCTLISQKPQFHIGGNYLFPYLTDKHLLHFGCKEKEEFVADRKLLKWKSLHWFLKAFESLDSAQKVLWDPCKYFCVICHAE